MLTHLQTARRLLRFREPGYLAYLCTGYLLPRLAHWLLFGPGPRRLRWLAATAVLGLAASAVLAVSAELGTKVGVGLAALFALGSVTVPVLLRRRQLREARQGLDAPGGHFLTWPEWSVDADVRRAVDVAPAEPPSDAPRGELVLGHIDGDGRLWSFWGAFPDFEPISEDGFLPRDRYTLDLVLLDGKVLIRKDYRGHGTELLREWHALSRLKGRANVPAVYAVSEERCWLYRSFLPGDTINDLLVRAGARIRLAQTRDDRDLNELSTTERLEAVLERGTRRLADAVPESVLEEMERQLDRIHRAGVARLSLTFGNVVIDSRGDPWFVDFDGAEAYRSTNSAAFAYRRDQDRVKFNRFYGRSLMTEGSARAVLREHFRRGYAPIDLGQGLASRGFWSVDSGTGRWDFLLREALAGLIEGRRILDLGSHHGLLPLLMLTAGARQVVAVEKSPEHVAQACHLHRLFEWRHLRRFDLDLRSGDMRTILSSDWGRFDLVTAFCSLYYLSESEMRRMVARAAQLAPILVLQGKTDTRAEADDNKAAKSSLSFLRTLLEENGFPRVEVIAPAGYSRPLLIGRRVPAAEPDPESRRASLEIRDQGGHVEGRH